MPMISTKNYLTASDKVELILNDSGIPTGGFINSSGLESAVSLFGLNSSNLQNFITTFMSSQAKILPIISEAYYCTSFSNFATIDKYYDVLLRTNAVIRDASIAQGIAFLLFFLNSLPSLFNSDQMKTLKDIKAAIRLSKLYGHYPTIYAIILGFISNHSKDDHYTKAMELFLLIQLKSVISAAVRLNLIGPFKGQEILYNNLDQCKHLVSVYLESGEGLDDVGNVCLLLDIMQGSHSKLYSRIFNS